MDQPFKLNHQSVLTFDGNVNRQVNRGSVAQTALTCLSPLSFLTWVSEVSTDFGYPYMGTRTRFDTHLMPAGLLSPGFLQGACNLGQVPQNVFVLRTPERNDFVSFRKLLGWRHHGQVHFKTGPH